METLQEKLKTILVSSLRECRTDLETLPNGHVCGDVISPEFDGMSYEDRYLRLRRIQEAGLTENEIINISTLLTYTPEEWAYEPKES